MGGKRARRRQTRCKKAKHPSLLKRINRHAAGIDCGSETHFVAVPPERDEEPVRSFKTFTSDLRRLADWLEACKIKTVAMESTSVYWIPIFEILEERGFEVVLVNSRHVKNVPGRKSDVLDCQWIQELHSVGLLRGSFRPAAEIATLRALGFHSGPVVISVLLESLLLALLGGVIGATLAWAVFDGFSASTLNWSSFSQLTFAIDVSLPLLVQGVVFALLIGFFGGLFPALRAARQPIATALREQ